MERLALCDNDLKKGLREYVMKSGETYKISFTLFERYCVTAAFLLPGGAARIVFPISEVDFARCDPGKPMEFMVTVPDGAGGEKGGLDIILTPRPVVDFEKTQEVDSIYALLSEISHALESLRKSEWKIWRVGVRFA